MTTEPKTALAPKASDPAPVREAVAWRWRFDAEGGWHYGDSAPGKFRFGDPEEVQPLYTDPMPVSREAVARAVLEAVFEGFEHGQCEKEWESEWGHDIARRATDAILALTGETSRE